MNKEIPQNRKAQFGWLGLTLLISIFMFIIATQACCGFASADTVDFYKSLLSESNEKYSIQYASTIDVVGEKGGSVCGGTILQREKGKPIVAVSAAHCFSPIPGETFKAEGLEIVIMVDPTEATIRQCLGKGENKCFSWKVKIVRLDREVDLALLIGNEPEKFSGPSVSVASEGAKVGDPIVMIGAPAGRSRNVSLGVVSFITLETEVGDILHYYTDAAIFFGSSGGGMFNANGELIGVAHTAFAPAYPFIVHGSGACIGLPHIQKIIEGVFEEQPKVEKKKTDSSF